MAIDPLLPPEDKSWFGKADRTRQWLGDIVCGIVDDEGLVSIWCEVSAIGPGVTFNVRVAKEDLGKVIGKDGRHARALRGLLSARARKDGSNYMMDIAERTTTSVEKEERHG